MFKEKIDKGLIFNILKLSAVIVINLDYILDKIKVNYVVSKKENLLLQKRDGLLKL